MRIAIIRLSAAPLVQPGDLGVFGGAEVRAFTFARGLAARAEHEVSFVVQSATSRPILPVGRLQIQVVRNARRTRRQDRTGWQRIESPLNTARRLAGSLARRVSGQPNLQPEFCRLPADVFCSFGLQDPTAAVIRTARRLGKPSVVFLTSDEDTRQALDASSSSDRHRRWHRYALDQADLIVAQTERQCEWIGRIDRPCVLIRNPIELQGPAGYPASIVNRRHVLWVGRADTDCKRADLFMSIAQRCPDVPFVAVMNPQDPVTTAALVRRAPRNVRIMERVSWERSDDLYGDALALVNTSDSEGFPNAFLQAAKFGVPIVSRRVNPDQILTRHGIGFVAHDDLNRLAAMIRQVAQTPRRFAAVATAARRYVERYHGRDDRVSELVASLTDLVQAARPSRAA